MRNQVSRPHTAPRIPHPPGTRKGNRIEYYPLSSLALGDLLEHGLERNLAEVGALNLGGDTGQGTAKGVLGGSVYHLALCMC